MGLAGFLRRRETEGQTGECRVKLSARIIRYGLGPDDVQQPLPRIRHPKGGASVAVCNRCRDGFLVILQVGQLHERAGQPAPFENDMNGKHPLCAKGVGIAFGHDLEAQSDRLRRARVRATAIGPDPEQDLCAPAVDVPADATCLDRPGGEDGREAFVPRKFKEAPLRQLGNGMGRLHHENMNARARKDGREIDDPAELTKLGAMIAATVGTKTFQPRDQCRVSVPSRPGIAMPDQHHCGDTRAWRGLKNMGLHPEIVRDGAGANAQKPEQDQPSHFFAFLRLIVCRQSLAGLGLVLLGAAPAHAHSDTGSAGGLVAGFLHPFLGPDHLLAMVSVGIWGAFLGRPMLVVLPSLFPVLMAAGALLAINAVPFPPVEVGIALSLIVLGTLIGLAARTSAVLAVLIVGGFGLFHGYAHGAELPFEANPTPYTIGFVVATGLLHLAGIGLGFARAHAAGDRALRAGGGAVALAGLWFLGRVILP